MTVTAMTNIFTKLMAMTTILAGAQSHAFSLSPAAAAGTMRPPIDQAAPKTTATATFAMG